MVGGFVGLLAIFILPTPAPGPVTAKDPALFVWEVRVPPIVVFGPGGSFDIGAPFPEWDQLADSKPNESAGMKC